MSLSGAVDGRSRPQPRRAPGAGRVVRAGRPALPARRGADAGRGRHGRVLAVLLAAALGAGGAVGLLVVAVPGALASVVGEGPAAARSAGPPPASEIVLPGTVVAGSSCVAADAHDIVAVTLDGVRRELPLDGCGSIVGSSATVRLLAAPDPSGPRVPRGAARVLGSGGTAPLTDPADPDHADPASPMAARITVTLTALAGLAMAGLLVTVGRESLRTRAASRTGPARSAAPSSPPAPRSSPAPQSSPVPAAGEGGTTATGTTTSTGSGTTGGTVAGEAADRPRSRARSLRAPHPVRSVRGDGRLGPGTERARRSPGDRSRPRRPR